MAKKTKNLQFYEAIGRRKRAVSRVRLYLVGKDKTATVDKIKIKAGEIYLNKHPLEKTYVKDYEKEYLINPLKLTNNADRFAISIYNSGGGKNGQIEAMTLGLAKAVIISDPSTKTVLKQAGLLTRDSRKRERRKVGTGGKARRAKQSPKR